VVVLRLEQHGQQGELLCFLQVASHHRNGTLAMRGTFSATFMLMYCGPEWEERISSRQI